MKLWSFIALLTAVLYGCSLFEEHPSVLEFEEHEKNLTAKNLALLNSKQPGDTIVIAFTGDTQRFYEETKSMVAVINSRPHTDFVLICGDITDFGLPVEYRWMNRVFSSLHFPYLTVIGNHDLLGSGSQYYGKMFGPENYWFNFGRYVFIAMNTNGREYGFNGTVPDIAWLDQTMNSIDPGKSLIFISHIRPADADFDPALVVPFGEAVNSKGNMMLGLHGHNHDSGWLFPYNDGIPYINTAAASERYYFELKLFTSESVGRDTFQIEKIYF